MGMKQRTMGRQKDGAGFGFPAAVIRSGEEGSGGTGKTHPIVTAVCFLSPFWSDRGRWLRVRERWRKDQKFSGGYRTGIFSELQRKRTFRSDHQFKLIILLRAVRLNGRNRFTFSCLYELKGRRNIKFIGKVRLSHNSSPPVRKVTDMGQQLSWLNCYRNAAVPPGSLVPGVCLGSYYSYFFKYYAQNRRKTRKIAKEVT